MHSAERLPRIELAGLDRRVNSLQIDPRWQAVIEPVVLFKDALDRVQNAAQVQEADCNLIQRHGLTVNEVRSSSFRPAVLPTQFAELILGPFCGPVERAKVRACVPAWAALGWVRKKAHLDAPPLVANAARTLLASMYRETRRSRFAGTASCYGGIPLFICSDGKSRGAFHRTHGFRQMIRVRAGEFPDAAALRVQRVAFHPKLIALHWQHGTKKETALLPFPALSLPILESYGVRLSEELWLGMLLPYSRIRVRGWQMPVAMISGFANLLRPDRFWRGVVSGVQRH